MHLEEDERQERKEVVTAHSGMTEVYRFLCGRRGDGRRGDRGRVGVGETEGGWEEGRQREGGRRRGYGRRGGRTGDRESREEIKGGRKEGSTEERWEGERSER